MLTSQVTVDYVNEPRDGKPFGSIKTKELGYVSVHPDNLGLFTKGQKYSINYETVVKGDREHHNFKSLANGFPEHDLPKAFQKSSQRSSEDATPERIYVCGIINSAIAHGGFALTLTNLVELTNTARSAWAQTFGKK